MYALNTVEDFVIRLNGIEVSDMKKLMYQSLVSASLQLSVDLRTEGFDAIAGQVDEFSIDKETAFRDERYLSFKLNYGFVDTATNAVSIVFGSSVSDLDAATPIDPEFIRVDKEKGLIILDMWGLSGDGTTRRFNLADNYYQSVFRITYDCGLKTTTTADGKVYAGVPSWLFELSLLKAREIYQYTNPILNGDGKPLNAKSVSVNIQGVLEKHIRIFPLAISPIM